MKLSNLDNHSEMSDFEKFKRLLYKYLLVFQRSSKKGCIRNNFLLFSITECKT